MANTRIMQNIFDALGTTLLHSLWQGALLAALTGLIISFTASISSARRYQILSGLLLLFCCAVAITFTNHLLLSDLTESHPATNYPEHNHIHTTGDAVTASVWQRVVAFVHAHNVTIVCVWLVVVAFRAVQMSIGLRGVYRLKRTGITAVDAAWSNRLNEISDALGIRRVVKLAESGLAKVPMVIGHFKPLILIPVGLLTALSTAEIQAILAHELAHISRKDYLVNLLFTLMEILFFLIRPFYG